MAAESKIPTQEREKRVMSGWVMLPVAIALYVVGPVLIALAFIDSTTSADGGVNPCGRYLVGGIVALGVAILLSPGFFTLQPNEARVLDPLRRLQGHLPSRAASAGATPSTPTARPGRPAASRSGRRTRSKGDGEAAQNAPKKLQALQDQPARPHPERRAS